MQWTHFVQFMSENLGFVKEVPHGQADEFVENNFKTYQVIKVWAKWWEEMCTAMTLHIKDLKLGYKFSTHPQREVPRILSTPAAFIRMKDDAVTQICERGNSLGKGKKGKCRDVFWVILVESGRKTREKTVFTKGKKNALAKGPLEEEDEPSEKGAGEHLSTAGHATLDNPPGSLQIEQQPSVRASTKQPTTGSGLTPSTSTSELLLMEFIKNNSSSRLYSRSQSRSQSQSSSP
ncbi:hypothetical protein BJ322DRAFT_1023025 [Thelephora terrestris]|uniref:Uncharacterized protein n=1 Tax=Thelephora terrestris TaxID=56493 RepID=A0A9P6L3G6_9AGAM|nr:hypothetical protein BJ322DRAFT_1023025 [Thelephora terrestris]